MAADFAMDFQVKTDMRVKEKYKKKSKASAKKHSPFFGPKPLVKGRPLTPNEVLDFRDSRFLNPPEELRTNKILPEVEIESMPEMPETLFFFAIRKRRGGRGEMRWRIAACKGAGA